MILRIFAVLFFASFAMAETQTFTIGLGTQVCTKDEENPGVEYCQKAEFKTEKESLELTGNEPWFKNFAPFNARVIIKKRAERYIVRLNIFEEKSGKDLAHYATEVKELKDLNLMKLAGPYIVVDEKSSVRGWIQVESP
jgi:hypothetical protein